MKIDTKAKEIMATPVIAVRNDTNLHNAEELLKKNKISGLPVLNEQDEIVGIISEKHLLSIYDIRAEEQDITDLSFRLPYEYKTWVEEIMTKEIIAVTEDTCVEEVCRLMVENHIHRVPVLRGKKVVGVISSLSLVGYLLRLIEKQKEE
ncbi:MAG: CBS domain-containing protein [Candidatus Erginobacter occultus]|nr:CBS domain-containing protein [Candidatus Erginobacter occultus]